MGRQRWKRTRPQESLSENPWRSYRMRPHSTKEVDVCATTSQYIRQTNSVSKYSQIFSSRQAMLLVFISEQIKGGLRSSAGRIYPQIQQISLSYPPFSFILLHQNAAPPIYHPARQHDPRPRPPSTHRFPNSSCPQPPLPYLPNLAR